MLNEADAILRAEVYHSLGIALTYHPDRKVVAVEADLSRVHKSVSEGGLAPEVHGRSTSSSSAGSPTALEQMIRTAIPS